MQLLIFNEEFLVSACHQRALITSLPFVHTARRSYRLNDPVRPPDCGNAAGSPAAMPREAVQTLSFRGRRSRNKVSVGEPAEGSLPVFPPALVRTARARRPAPCGVASRAGLSWARRARVPLSLSRGRGVRVRASNLCPRSALVASRPRESSGAQALFARGVDASASRLAGSRVCRLATARASSRVVCGRRVPHSTRVARALS